MKKLFIIVLPFIFLSCASVDVSILRSSDRPIQKRLKTLKIGLGEESVVRNETIKTVTIQTDFATIFSREMETNFFENTRQNWGYIEYKIVFDNTNIDPISYPVMAAHLIWVFVPSIFGAGILKFTRTIEAEISIFDSKEAKIKKYVISSTSKPIWVTLYNDLTEWGTKRLAGVEITKDIINQFKSLLSSDIVYINNELEKSGPIDK